MKKNSILAFSLFFVLTLIVTYPLILNFNNHIPGFQSTSEPYSLVWNNWRIANALEEGTPLMKTNLISHPFGYNFREHGTGTEYYLRLGFRILLTKVFGPVGAYNIQIMLNFLLTALFTYLLVVYLTKSRAAGILSAIIFSFSPQHFVRSWQHIGLTYFQWIPLMLLACIYLKEKRNKISFFLFLLSLIFLYSFDYTIAYLGLISLVCFMLYNFIKTKKKDARIQLQDKLKFSGKVLAAVIIAFLILAPQFFPIFKNYSKKTQLQPSIFNSYRRSFDDLFTQSARPFSYFLPPVFHPLLGDITSKFVGSSLYGLSTTEHTLYLGFIGLILAFFSFKKYKNRKEKSNQAKDRKRDNFYYIFFIMLLIISYLFSQPPWWRIGAIKIYMPSFFMYKILPMFRAYCRFGILVIFAVAVLAGYYLKFTLSNISKRSHRILILSVICTLVLFEFWTWPPYKVIDFSRAPAVYQWLSQKKEDFAIAEYPLYVDNPHEIYKFYQITHKKPIINITIPGTYPNELAKKLTDISDYQTASMLKLMGVKYIIVHKQKYLQSELVDKIKQIEEIKNNKGLVFVKSFQPQSCPEGVMCAYKTGAIDVYEVIAGAESLDSQFLETLNKETE